VIAEPDTLATAAADAAGIGSSLTEANAAAAASTTGVIAAGGDEVATGRVDGGVDGRPRAGLARFETRQATFVLAVASQMHADLLAATIDARWLTSGDTISM
jgi:hypothetical protein